MFIDKYLHTCIKVTMYKDVGFILILCCSIYYGVHCITVIAVLYSNVIAIVDIILLSLGIYVCFLETSPVTG